MIPIREIKEMARLFGVPPSTIERDYAQNWLLSSFGSLHMVLKGDTGIRKVFIEQYRFSDDLDFTLTKPYEPDHLVDLIRQCVVSIREISGIPFQDDVNLIHTKSGFRGTVFFRLIPSGADIPIKIDLDITDPSNEEILLPIENRDIIHLYSDSLAGTVPSYALDEIMGEKIRSLFERTRPRDLYDVYHLMPRVHKSVVTDIFRKKCEYKGINPTMPDIMVKKDQYQKAWEKSLRHQMKVLPDFTMMFESVCSDLKALGIPD
ncbi:MAG: nucleotidyl transferase AbiEii/AbiGii toxin family protein [Methanospirillum sp.]|nr:nucleotidyl transferase AbiEii/AbiGii toxin family protein [Methanospirillum sp.]